MIANKFILDACCGGKNMWFNKNHPNTLYIDHREREKGHAMRAKNKYHSIKPDMVMDNRKLDFKNNSFKLVVLDLPFFTRNEGYNAKSDMVQCYGYLSPKTWKEDIKRAFDEAWRVLEEYGVLIFKWNEMQKKKKEVLEVLGREPLFGHSTKNYTNTIWFCFMKIPEPKKPTGSLEK
ncbi:MAG: class I SAM-dependent methyltransferase [Bacteroidetes bacterium]|nr:class I SAM-dependent methyltransferase [Bacteroidota bacterium]